MFEVCLTIFRIEEWLFKDSANFASLSRKIFYNKDTIFGNTSNSKIGVKLKKKNLLYK